MNNPQLESRLSIIDMILQSNEGHIASSYSIIEILTAIYQVLEEQGQSDRFLDHLILSKGHSVYALYGFMRSKGLLTDQEIASVGTVGSYLIGHVPVKPERGFYIGTGSLGQGWPMALGRAFARRLAGDPVAEFVIVGDGEFNEGSCWEALLLMKKFPDLKMRVVIDNNHSSTRAIPLDDVFNAVRAGWNTVDVDGHSLGDLTAALSDPSDKNLVIIADTQKGYPLQRMRNNPVWHHRMPNRAEAEEMKNELHEFFGGAR